VLSLGHLSTLFIPLLLAHSHLLLLLSCVLDVLVCILMGILIHIIDVYVLLSFIVHMCVARDSLKFLDNKFLRFAFLSFPSAGVQRIDFLYSFKLIRL